MTARNITIAGAGIIGLWQALTLARAGHRVRLFDVSDIAFAQAASRYAGAMLAPYCEAESAPAPVREFGREGLTLWRKTYPDLVTAGTLVVAAARDHSELTRFAKMTQGHRMLGQCELADLEPDLAERFSQGLFFPDEAHLAAPVALSFLLEAVRATGTEVTFGEAASENNYADGIFIDCRGMQARDVLPRLRGVRGERLLIQTSEVKLSRPVRLLHPRHPLYVVPWSDGRFMVGATLIESEDAGPVSVRSALELLGTAYALHPAFGEAAIIEMDAGVRPAFADNVPLAIVRGDGRHILVNGAYRHGFLLAPILAYAVCDYITTGSVHPLLKAIDP